TTSTEMCPSGTGTWASPKRRPALCGDTSVDVAIVGVASPGLWTAYYLKAAQPDLRVAVLEAEFAGFGASGRSGGWLGAEPPGELAATRRHTISTPPSDYSARCSQPSTR
ncbi:MAG: FAD-dependent oxidoreductase, partial [Nocardioidaceae bacterium]